MRLKLLLIAMLSGMSVHAPAEPESGAWPDWNIPVSFQQGSIGESLKTCYSGVCTFVKSLFTDSMNKSIKEFGAKIEGIMTKIDPSLKNDRLQMVVAALKLVVWDFKLFSHQHLHLDARAVCPEHILWILESDPKEIWNRIKVLETAIDKNPDLVRLIRHVIGLKLFSSSNVCQFIEHLKENRDNHSELEINPEHFDSIYGQMCAQKYKYVINLLLVMDERKPGRLGKDP